MGADHSLQSPTKCTGPLRPRMLWRAGCRPTGSHAQCTRWTPKWAAPTECHLQILPLGHSFGGKYLDLVPDELIRYTDRFEDPNLLGEMITTVTLRPVSVGTEVNIVQEGLPAAIPLEACYLGWQQSLNHLATLVEPEIKD